MTEQFDSQTEEIWDQCLKNALAVFATEHAFRVAPQDQRLSEHEAELVHSGVASGVAGTITALKDKGMLKVPDA